ncbi:MAG: alpha/beta fold hydrolase [Chitinophagaceae bacterium]|nr:MAG: alpha/beta fold hydrolase [Chitinophagaceae bacterium]
MTDLSFTLKCADGHSMPIYGWLPAEKPSAVIHICHGMAEYGERYDQIARYFTGHGIAVFAHDNRGHGQAVSSTSLQGITVNNWFYLQVEDIDLCIQHHRKEYADKIFLLGHSMGSFLAQRYFQLHGTHIDGLILSASNGKQDPLMGAGIGLAWLQMKLFGSRFKSHMIDYLSFGQFNKKFKPNRTVSDWLTKDQAEVDKYVADPRCGFVCSASFYYYFFTGIRDAFKNVNIRSIPRDIPVYAFSGSKDPVGLEGKGFLYLVKRWKQAGVKDFTYHLYENGRHEMMNELNREEVLENVVSFIKQHS